MCQVQVLWIIGQVVQSEGLLKMVRCQPRQHFCLSCFETLLGTCVFLSFDFRESGSCTELNSASHKTTLRGAGMAQW